MLPQAPIDPPAAEAESKTEMVPGSGGLAPARVALKRKCAACDRIVGDAEFHLKESAQYPFGARSQQGEALCMEHRVTCCSACDGLFPRTNTRKVTVGWRPRRRHLLDVTPRWEEVVSRLCVDCSREYEQPTLPPRYCVHPGQVLLLAVIAIGACAAFYLVATGKLARFR